MQTSRTRPRPADTFAEQALALAWGAWTELGVSGWTSSTHGDWAIDPEPLILFTAFLGDADPRLRDEATDWCIRNWRFVSKTRLKNLLRAQWADVGDEFGEFAATVGAHAGIAWPGQTEPRRYAVTGRSTLPPLERPSLAWLRLRAMFGLGARTEILRYFLSRAGKGAVPVSRLAAVTGYTKRNVAAESETLERAGVLGVRSTTNRLYYYLARRSELEAFVGELPDVRPNWSATLNIARELVDLEDQAEAAAQRTLPVKVRQMLKRIEDDLDELDIERPSDDLRGEALWPAIRRLGNEYLGAWSIGDWPEDDDSSTQETQADLRRLRPRAR